MAAAIAASLVTSAVAADPLVHVVAAGETLYGIARAYDVPVDAIVKANALRDPSKLVAGTRLTIPGKTAAAPAPSPAPQAGKPPAPSATEYVVKKGDTLFGIAKAHGVGVDDVIKASGLTSSSIKVGQKLSIPSSDQGRSASAGVGAQATAQTGAAATGTKAAVAGGSTATSSGSSASGPTAATTAASGTKAAGLSTAKAWPAAGRVESLKGRLKGVSIAAGASAPIEAVRAGTVVSAGPFYGFSQVAFVQAADGFIYVYGGAVALAVKVGEAVRRGTVIGRTGPNPDANAYFFVFDTDSNTVDPASVPRD